MSTERRTRRLTAENATTSAGEAVYVDIVEDLNWGELKRLQRLEKPTYDDAAAAISPYVTAWNVEGRNADTGEFEALPAPAEAGADVFDAVEPWVIDWLFLMLRTVHVGGDALRKKLTPANATPDGQNAVA